MCACANVHNLLTGYIMCTGTSCVQVHLVYRYIMCTGTSYVQVHHVYRYIPYMYIQSRYRTLHVFPQVQVQY